MTHATAPSPSPVRLTPDHVARLEAFFEKIKSQTYPEAPTNLHSGLTREMLTRLTSRYVLPPGTRVLDVGCGQGVALERFRELGWEATGITLNEEDVRVCRGKGYDVSAMDQSFLDFRDASFDLLWCRHCLEHSVLPLFTLHEFHRVLSPGGVLYVEVPAPDTSCRHQSNPNHYSVLGLSMWSELLQRSGFRVEETLTVNFTTGAGPDTYWAFFQRKAAEPAEHPPRRGEAPGQRIREAGRQ
jgi:ubiquinone/menaquinone biosynthesis C-methylase UbiE